jgi:hypothetical protein
VLVEWNARVEQIVEGKTPEKVVAFSALMDSGAAAQ